MNYLVKELYIYPIKSLAGIAVQSAKAEEMGFENDRRWMLIDEDNQCITQRNHPNLSQFYPIIKEDKIEILHQDTKHEFSILESLNEPIFSNVWDDESKVIEVNKETSKWFSDALGFTCKLVKILYTGDRKHKSNTLNKTLNVSLADGYPYLLIGSESLDALNEKLKEKITIKRFRPNIVISTEEDTFDSFQIANLNFQNAKPCGRCIMVNNDPKTGIVKKEPLKTLSTYRNGNNTILFGINILCINEGMVAVGDNLVFRMKQN
jgi:uncharacterized protein YcbX